MNKPEIDHRLCKTSQCTKFFIEIGCSDTGKQEKLRNLKPGGGLCLL